MTREELIAELDQGEGPSRALDGEIALRRGWTFEKKPVDRIRWWYGPDGRRHLDGWRYGPPRYTEVLDIALSLFAERPDIASTDPRKVCSAALAAEG